MLTVSGLLAQAPVNDDVCNATGLLVDGSTNSFDNFNSTVQTGEQSIAPPAGNGLGNSEWFEDGITSSVWFTFTAPASGAVEFDMCSDGTNFDTQIAVYDVIDCNDFGTFNLIGANDDIPNGCPAPADEYASRLEVYCMVPGQTYYILIDGWFSSGVSADTVGNFDIALTEIPAPDLTLDVLSLPPTCNGATDAILAASGAGGGLPYQFSWTIPGGGVAASQVLINRGPGTYTVELRDACDTVRTATVTLDDPAPLTLNASPFVEANCDSTYNLGDAYSIADARDESIERKRAYQYLNTATAPFKRTNLRNPSVIDNIDYDFGPTFPLLLGGDFVDSLFAIGSADFNQIFAYRVNPETGDFTQLPTAISLPAEHTLVDAAYDATTGTFYVMALFTPPATQPGSFFIDTTRIFSVDLTTGATNFVTNVVLDPFHPIFFAIDTAGVAYTADEFTSSLYAFDVTTGAATLVGDMAITVDNLYFATNNPNNPRIKAFRADVDPLTNNLYATLPGPDGPQVLYTISTETGRAVPLGNTVGSESFMMAIASEAPDNEPYTYSWISAGPLSADTVAAPAIEGLSNDSVTYLLLVEDECGAQADAEIVVTYPLGISTEVGTDSTTGNAFASVIVNKGTPPYQFAWNDPNSTTDSVLTDVAAGVYLVTVQDANGCRRSLPVEVLATDIAQPLPGLQRFRAYPNPTTGQVRLDVRMAQPTDLTLTLQSLQGQVLRQAAMSATSSFEQTWALDDLAAGLYLLNLRTPQGQRTIKLSVR